MHDVGGIFVGRRAGDLVLGAELLHRLDDSRFVVGIQALLVDHGLDELAHHGKLPVPRRPREGVPSFGREENRLCRCSLFLLLFRFLLLLLFLLRFLLLFLFSQTLAAFR